MSFNRLLFAVFFPVVLVVLSAGGAQAAFVAYHDFASFSAALVDQAVIQETYEAEVVDTVIPNGGTLNGLTYDFPLGLDGRIDDTFPNLGSFGLAAERDGIPGAEPDGFDLFLPGESITITLPFYTRSVGVYINTEVADSTMFSISVAGQGSVPTNGVYDDGVSYFVGMIVDEPFQQATISAELLAGGGYTVDDVTFVAPRPGDVNEDGAVNIFDINLVSAHWGESGPIGDANFDMAVNIFDINLISAHWTASGGAAAVPEPGTLGLLIAGAALLIAIAHRWMPARGGADRG